MRVKFDAIRLQIRVYRLTGKTSQNRRRASFHAHFAPGIKTDIVAPLGSLKYTQEIGLICIMHKYSSGVGGYNTGNVSYKTKHSKIFSFSNSAKGHFLILPIFRIL